MERRDFLLLASTPALISSIGLNISCSRSKDSNNTSGKEADLDKLIPQLLKETKTPGLSLAIVRNGKMTWNKAFGVKDTTTNEPVDIDTTFEAASVSKTVFAYAMMKLHEKKVLNLDTPLSQYYPELFAKGDSRLQTITARQVLSHQTGLPNMRSAEDPMTFHFNPGTNFTYSGEGYYLLQTVVTHLVGKVYPEPCGTYENDLQVCATDIADYLKANILVPFGMTSSSYLWTEQLGENNAAAHDVDEKMFPKPHQNASDMARYAALGGLLTTAKDYSKFLISLFTGKDNDPFRLSAASLSEMFRPHTKLPPDQPIDECTSWGLGWGIQERPTGNLIVHSGGQSGFRSLTMASLDKKSGFVALTNGDNGGKLVYHLKEVLSDLW
jgi:CubicO group peptidase (beta-lactamase class C family)